MAAATATTGKTREENEMVDRDNTLAKVFDTKEDDIVKDRITQRGAFLKARMTLFDESITSLALLRRTDASARNKVSAGFLMELDSFV